MAASDLTAWYVALCVGAACVFAVVVAVVVMLQLSSDISRQLIGVRDGLTLIRSGTAAILAISEINSDMRELNAVLAESREHLGLLLEVPT